MVKLTPELIEHAVQYVNPVRDRELVLRGYKIPVIENLGATLDQFDTIDFSDNDLRKFENFPLLKRIRSLMFNNNRICRIEEEIFQSIPNLKELYLTNNEIADLSDIDYLVGFKHLEFLSLLRNPVTHHREYRSYVVYKLPQIRLLDFRRVRLHEREEAKKLFGSEKGEAILTDIKKTVKNKTFTPGQAPTQDMDTSSVPGPSQEDKLAIKDAILKAKSLEEIETLKLMLQAGKIPGKEINGLTNGNTEKNDMEVA